MMTPQRFFMGLWTAAVVIYWLASVIATLLVTLYVLITADKTHDPSAIVMILLAAICAARTLVRDAKGWADSQ